MELKTISVQPLKGVLAPELHIKLEFYYRAMSLIPIGLTGYIFLDGIKIADLSELEYGRGIREELKPMNRAREIENVFSISLHAPLSRLAIEKINASRSANSKGDVHFEVKLSLKCIESSFDCVRPKAEKNPPILVSLPGDALVRYSVYPFNHNYIISASDWLHDFYQYFSLEKFIVVEIPVIQSFQPSNNKDELVNRIKEALQSFEEMKKAMEKPDWNQVIKESRPIWELSRKQNEIEALLKSDSFSEATIQSFNDLLQALFNFASKFIHKEDKSQQLMPYSKAAKEDAILIYTMAASILNLIGQKKNRIEA